MLSWMVDYGLEIFNYYDYVYIVIDGGGYLIGWEIYYVGFMSFMLLE